MEYRSLKNDTKSVSSVGMGMGGIHCCSEDEIYRIVSKAIDNGINYFDMCCCHPKVFKAFGKAIEGRRDKVVFPVHFGAVFNEKGEYGWSRNHDQIMNAVNWEFETMMIDYADIGYLHCVDQIEDYEKLCAIGIFDEIKKFKAEGKIHHIGFSSHTPEVANKIIDTGLIDFMMFSINPAYDYEQGDEYGAGSAKERKALFERCQKEDIGIAVMKPFFAGKLLNADDSPFGVALTHYQCIQYALDRPGVKTIVPGVTSMEQLEMLLGFDKASEEEKDYSAIATFTAKKVNGQCVYCSHCHPCPAGIDIALVNKYYDLSLAGDRIAANHYTKLEYNAGDCIGCGHCDNRCPFGVEQSSRMKKIDEYFTRMKKWKSISSMDGKQQTVRL